MDSRRIVFSIPGRGELTIENIVFDLNGTLAEDGALAEGVRSRLGALGERVRLFVLTADTHGNAARLCTGLPVELIAFAGEDTASHKANFVRRLGRGVAAVGNGANDIAMFDSACLSVAVMGREGASAKLLLAADIAVPGPCEALDLFLLPHRLCATLRT